MCKINLDSHEEESTLPKISHEIYITTSRNYYKLFKFKDKPENAAKI